MDWIDLIARGFQLFESGIWFIGGLIMLLIGLLLVWESVGYRLRAFRTTAKILGVIPNTRNEEIKPHYYPVYEFTTPDGELIRTKARNAGSLAKYQPNTQLPVFIDPEDVHEVRGRVPVAFIVGIFMLLSGLAFFKIADVAGRSLLWSGAVAFGIIVIWMLKNIVQNGIRSPEERKRWKEERKHQPKFSIRHSKRPAEKFELSSILSSEEHWEALRKQDRSSLKWMPLVLLIAIGLLGFGGVKGYHRGRLTFAGEHTTGKVIRIETSRGEETSYYSVVKFTDQNNQKVEVRDEFGSSTPVDERGDELAVVYDPQNPEDALIDRGVWSWLLPVGFSGVGLAICWGYVNFLRGYFQRRKRDF